ncbi:serine/threonine protein kinase [Planomonospora sphaerica]|uniref:Serine/threonine protein kinase n=1 Tax=Planomonospora sphaerica TaxID=161355 RepID=A0A171CH27_9ACTN|nr:serine/threonine protein kinase [Planomonospora sphaerica]
MTRLLRRHGGGDARVREAARKALEEFGRAGLPEHPAAFEAAAVLVDAELALHARRPYPFGRADREQLGAMERLCRDHHERFGPDNPLTLSARASHGIHLVRWGDPERGRAVLRAVEEDARLLLGDRRPSRLRALYGLSVAALLTKDHPAAADLAEQAYRGQCLVLGEHHPDTLFSLMQLGIARTLTGGNPRAVATVRRARRGLAEVLGPRHEEIVRGHVSEVLGGLPRPVLLAVVHAADFLNQAPGAVRRAVRDLFGRR